MLTCLSFLAILNWMNTEENLKIIKSKISEISTKIAESQQHNARKGKVEGKGEGKSEGEGKYEGGEEKGEGKGEGKFVSLSALRRKLNDLHKEDEMLQSQVVEMIKHQEQVC